MDQRTVEKIAELRCAMLNITTAIDAILSILPETNDNRIMRHMAADANATATGILCGNTPASVRFHAARRYLDQARSLGLTVVKGGK